MNADQSIEDVYPLSPMQQGMLFSSLYAPDSGVYFTQVLCSLRGALNVAALDGAWAKVLERHSILRTAFIWEGMDEPLQVVQRHVKLPMEQYDWTGIPESEFRQHLQVFLKEDRRRGFSLSEAPLLRFILIRTGEDSYQFIWCYHHLLIDGWCHVIILREVFAYYEALCRGQRIEVEQARPYRDYIAWLQRQDHSAAEAYWRQYLRGFTSPTPLGVDRCGQHNIRTSSAYAHQEQLMGAELTEAVQQMGRHYRLTINTIVQSAWALLLARYSRHRDVLYGVTVSGRPGELRGVERMVGLFINTLPVRVRVEESEEVEKWLGRVQGEQVELRQYEYSALVEVQGWSEVEAGRPLFESVFTFENYPVGSFSRQRVGSIEVGEAHQIEGEDGPLTVTVSLNTDLAIDISYDSSRFDAAVISRMLGHMKMLLEGFVTHPSARLCDLPLLSEAERYQLLVQFNQTAKEFPRHQCLHHLFEAQVERTPEAMALRSDNTELSYRELNERANQVAHYLRSLGVGPEVLVGLLLTRSIEMVVALLGVLKAGGAYVPIDPEYPRERLSFMLKDAAVKVLLTESQFESGLAEQVEVNIVTLEAAMHRINQQSVENPPPSTEAEHLAYVIYTSGSTGRPKGVMVTHGALVNYALEMAHQLPLRASDRILQFASVGFDVMVEELFPTWVSGASVVLPTASTQELAGELSRFIARERITGVELPTAGWHAWLQQLSGAGEAGPPECLRFVIVGGERASMEDVRAWHRWEAELIHVYGVTEATVTTTVHREKSVASNSREEERAGGERRVIELDGQSLEFPLGQAIANAEVYVLDERMELVPVGVTGELYIGGVGLSRGYLRRPELTAERFVPHPFSKEKGTRLYRSGDLVRWREDAELEYVGRVDEQVKIRGYRVELGEIEAVLRQHAGVNEALVVVHEQHDEKELIAYVVPRTGHTSANGDELREFVKQQLPAYMVPGRYVLLEKFPLNAHGKVERSALPAPERGRAETGVEYVAPKTPLEETVASIWAEVLRVERVGVKDSFFALGGHSLLAMQVTSRIREALELEIPLRAIFEHRTVESYALAVLQHQIEEGRNEDLSELLTELDGLSDERARALLSDKP
jgi:amino acid adenylation domain-containing protein